ncbi:MAG: glycosyltransferase family 2 protein [bacterium]|nr:glycosyltransferase family 2 protein [bacterium]
MRVFVVIPAYNEGDHIAKVISRTKKYAKNIIVVDDGSTDETYKEAKKTGVIVLRHLVNLGKGAALKTGCDYAYINGADAIISMDGDLQHNPKEIPAFAKAIKNTDVVFGYRSYNKKMPFVLKFGNWFIEYTSKFLFGMKILDTQSGFKAFKRNVYRRIRWTARDYAVESEIIARVGRHGFRYRQLPIETIYTDRYKGTTAVDGFKIVLRMVWWKITR